MSRPEVLVAARRLRLVRLVEHLPRPVEVPVRVVPAAQEVRRVPVAMVALLDPEASAA